MVNTQILTIYATQKVGQFLGTVGRTAQTYGESERDGNGKAWRNVGRTCHEEYYRHGAK